MCKFDGVMMRLVSRGFAFFLLAGVPLITVAQLAEKPSLRVAQRQGRALPAGANADHNIVSLSSIGDQQQFSSIARTYNMGSSHAIIHTLFVVDRKAANQVYFLNANRFPFHEDFLRAQLLPALDRPTLNTFYSAPDRRFIMGTLGWYAELQRWVFEFWEGDRLTPELLSIAQKALAANFFAPLTFKANSTRQEVVGSQLGIATLTETQILGQRNYNALNIGTAIGRLRLVNNIEDES
ncbi:MAG TPA: hypothetical protein VL381_04160, partial [Rhodocyclaceae bacterium]|nr:hypothetical protein [Rhodocyclaceae bacterium]